MEYNLHVLDLIKQSKHILLTIATLLCSLAASAEDFSVDGIYYNITSEEDKTVEVTYRGDSYNSYSGEYSGAVTIPSTVNYDGAAYSVTSIGVQAFEKCSSLTSITIGKNVVAIGDISDATTSSGVFSGCTALKKVIFEDGDETLAVEHNSRFKGLFYDCPLEKVYLGRNLSYDASKNSGYSPFYNRKALASVTIGSEVIELPAMLFANCTAIDTITCHAVTPPTCASDAFKGVDTSISVYVPEASLTQYKEAEVWKFCRCRVWH